MQPVKLVLVEDMPMEAEIAIRQLESGGFSCNWKRVDSEQLLRRTLAESNPDLILSDFTLPGFDGLSALEIAHEVSPDTPFIFLSGTIGEERAIDALQRGAYDYVLKTNMARLVPAVRRALNDSSIRRARVALARALLAPAAASTMPTPAIVPTATTRATWACPRCGAPMILGPIYAARALIAVTLRFDTS